MSLMPRLEGIDLKPWHTFRLPCMAKSVQAIRTPLGLACYAADLRQGKPLYLLGEGSNSVFVADQPDLTVYRMAMKGKQYLGVKNQHHILRVKAGENWHELVEWTIAKGMPGLENLALIPGSVGASPVQNIGAYGVELVDRIAGVEVFELEGGSTRYLPAQECQFAYRDSIFKKELAGRVVITAVDFALPVCWVAQLGYGDIARQVEAMGAVTPVNVMNAVIQTRTGKLPDPDVLGNSGSFFKNPIVESSVAQSILQEHPNMPVFSAGTGYSKLAAGWLIDQCGLKGQAVGGVRVYENQALILVNDGTGTGADLLGLISRIKQTVKDRFGLTLEAEPNLIGL